MGAIPGITLCAKPFWPAQVPLDGCWIAQERCTEQFFPAPLGRCFGTDGVLCQRWGLRLYFFPLDPCDILKLTLRLDRLHEVLDADDVEHARQIVGQYTGAISVATFGSVFIKKCVAPIRILIVPNGCSTVSRRVRIASGFLSSLPCTASTTSSCSHRVLRRCGPLVHFAFSAQVRHAVVQ